MGFLETTATVKGEFRKPAAVWESRGEEKEDAGLPFFTDAPHPAHGASAQETSSSRTVMSNRQPKDATSAKVNVKRHFRERGSVEERR